MSTAHWTWISKAFFRRTQAMRFSQKVAYSGEKCTRGTPSYVKISILINYIPEITFVYICVSGHFSQYHHDHDHQQHTGDHICVSPQLSQDLPVARSPH